MIAAHPSQATSERPQNPRQPQNLTKLPFVRVSQGGQLSRYVRLNCRRWTASEPEDIGKQLPVINHVRNRAMVLALLQTGMRIGELLELKVVNVNIKEKRAETG